MALVCVPLHLVGVPLQGALWGPSWLVPSLRETRDSLGCLLVRNRRIMENRLRPLRWRCVLAGYLLPFAPRLAGALFRRFYPALAVFTWLAVVSVLDGVLLLPWALL